jgi:periplasmic divalent cation tolerance protein
MEEPVLVTTTFASQEQAEEMARLLLKKRLVACAQINGPVESLYWWKDEIAESVEFVLSVKTIDSLYTLVEATILDEHPYDVPEIIASPVPRISAPYLRWMLKELGK